MAYLRKARLRPNYISSTLFSKGLGSTIGRVSAPIENALGDSGESEDSDPGCCYDTAGRFVFS